MMSRPGPVLLVFLLSCAAFSQSGYINTIAGGYPLGDGGPAVRAALYTPSGVAVDKEGNVYIADRIDQRIRKVTPAGIITTIAGTGFPDHAVVNGPALRTGLAFPTATASDASGNVYFIEEGSNRVRQLSTDGFLRIVAGNSQPGFSGDGGPATQARLNNPSGVAVDNEGNLYIADAGNARVRKVDTGGIITTVVGNGAVGSSGDGGPALQARLSNPGQLAFDSEGNLYVLERGGNRLRKVSRSGIISTVLVGGGQPGAASSVPDSLMGVAVRVPATLYVNTNGPVYRLSGQEPPQIVRGTEPPAIPSEPGLRRVFGSRDQIAVDAAGNVYRMDSLSRLWRIDAAGNAAIAAGAGCLTGDGGPAAFSLTPHPMAAAVDLTGNVYTASCGFIRRIGADGRINTLGGAVDFCKTVPPDEPVPAKSACILTDRLATDPAGNILFIWDNYGFRLGPDGMVTMLRGTENRQLGGISTHQAAIAVDRSGNFYVADADRHRIHKVGADGVASVVAGDGTRGFDGDGGPATKARLSGPRGLAIDDLGNLYISDTGNYRVRKVDSAGIISTIAGNGLPGFAGDGGPASRAQIDSPLGLAVDGAGNLFIGDSRRIRKISPSGVITTIAGTGVYAFGGDGGPAAQALVSFAWGLAADAGGNLYIADPHSNRIRRVQGSSPFLVNPTGLLFAFPLGAQPAARNLSLAATDREARPFVVTSSAPWLTVSPSRGTLPAGGMGLSISANPVGMPKGTYSARLTVTNPDSGEYVIVPVTMTISGTPQQLKLSQTGLTFVATPSAAAASQRFSVLNAGAGSMNWTLSTSTLSGGAGWLVAGPTAGNTVAGSTPPQVEVRTNAAGLAAGAYYGLVTVSAPGVDNSPQSAVVLLVVTPSDQPPGPVVDPAGLIFTSAAPQFLRLSNLSPRVVQFTATASFPDAKNWFTLPVPSGSLTAGQTANFDILPTLQGLAAGVYRAIISIRFQPDNVTRTVTLLLVVAPTAAKTTQRQADPACTPQRLLPVFRSPGESFAVTAGWPSAVEVEVVDNCGRPMNQGQVLATFSNNDPPLALVSLGAGRWTATWASRAVRRGNVEISVKAQVPVEKLEGEARVSGGVKENPDQPLIAAGGVMNAASFRRQMPLAPGSYVSIFGTKLARETQAAARMPLPVELGETLATVAGRALPLHFTSDGQVNAVLPYGIADSTEHQVIVRQGKMYSLPEPVLVATSEPAAFTTGGGGAGQGHVYVATEDGLVLAGASRPAKAGEVVVVYATGLGPVTPGVKEGEAAPGQPLSEVMAPVTAAIQGKDAEVIFAGLAPGLAGVYQVNVMVPDGVTPDASAVLILNVGQQSSSPPVTFAVTVEEMP
jgi:uncharacterized protein (TIGR03437 family)